MQHSMLVMYAMSEPIKCSPRWYVTTELTSMSVISPATMSANIVLLFISMSAPLFIRRPNTAYSSQYDIR